jgi:glutamate racemase
LNFMEKEKPIGVFDSGIGGLTVVKRIVSYLPREDIVYFGDTARVPYGSKSNDTVIEYGLQDAKFLMNKNIKALVVACNTVSSVALNNLKNNFDIPIIGMIEPGAKMASLETKNKKVGVIGTRATISNQAYSKKIKSLDPSIHVFERSCPLFVPLAEEGWWENDIASRIAQEYLNDMKGRDIDTLVLGCTHYPLLHNTISKVMGKEVSLVNSGPEVANVVKKLLSAGGIERDPQLCPIYQYYTSDSVEKFQSLGSSFLGSNIQSVQKVDIEKY